MIGGAHCGSLPPSTLGFIKRDPPRMVQASCADRADATLMVDGEAVGAMALDALRARGAREERAHVDVAAFLAEPVCSKPAPDNALAVQRPVEFGALNWRCEPVRDEHMVAFCSARWVDQSCSDVDATVLGPLPTLVHRTRRNEVARSPRRSPY